MYSYFTLQVLFNLQVSLEWDAGEVWLKLCQTYGYSLFVVLGLQAQPHLLPYNKKKTAVQSVESGKAV